MGAEEWLVWRQGADLATMGGELFKQVVQEPTKAKFLPLIRVNGVGLPAGRGCGINLLTILL